MFYTNVSRSWRAATLLAALLAVGGARAQDFWSRSYEPVRHMNDPVPAAARFKAVDELAIKDPKLISDYVKAGINLSDLACEQWLGVLGRSDRDVSLAKDLLNIVGNVILGISGINGANPSSLARGSLGLAAGNASIDSFKNEIILGSISDIEAKLREGRKVSAALIKANIPSQYDDAKAMLIEYHAGCGPNAVKTLLKTSLASVKYVPPDTSLSSAIKSASSDVYAGELVEDIYGRGAGPTVSGDALYELYVTEIVAPGATSPPFILDMKADVATLARDFESKNKDERLRWLQTVADLRGYPERYNAQKAAEEAKAKNTVAAANAAVASGTAEAERTKPEKTEALVAKAPPSARNNLSNFYSAPFSLKLTPRLADDLQQSGAAIERSSNASADKAHGRALARLSARVQERTVASAALSEIQQAPAAPQSTAGGAIRDTGLPVSISAVLVPIGSK